MTQDSTLARALTAVLAEIRNAVRSYFAPIGMVINGTIQSARRATQPEAPEALPHK